MMHHYIYTELSLYLARAFGLFAVILTLAILTNTKRMEGIAEEISKTPALLCLIGIANLALGLLLILHHNIWQLHWSVIITLIGWGMLLKGILALFFSEHMARVIKAMV